MIKYQKYAIIMILNSFAVFLTAQNVLNFLKLILATGSQEWVVKMGTVIMILIHHGEIMLLMCAYLNVTKLTIVKNV
jgi:hypothetical protein